VAGYAFHTGALAALETHLGWDPRSADLVVGTSSGSIMAAGLRAGLSTVELRRRALGEGSGDEADPLEQLVGPGVFRLPHLRGGPSAPGLVVKELRRWRRLQPGNVLTGLLPEGRVPTDPLHQVIEPLHPNGWPDAPLWITAIDQRSGVRRVFGRWHDLSVGVATAVRASCAVPGYFAPVAVDGRTYVDGGVRSPDNLDVVADQALDLVVVLSPLSVDQVAVARSPLTSFLRAYPRRRLRINVDHLRRNGTEVVVVQPDRQLAELIGLNAMAANRLKPVLTGTEALIERWATDLDPDIRAVLDQLPAP
jgi:NTE family protein